LLSSLFLLLAGTILSASPVVFDRVEATNYSGSVQDLQKIIRGIGPSARGWSLASSVEKPESAIFITKSPVEADLLQFEMFFLSGRPNASFANFELSYTCDPEPTFASRWVSLAPIACGATACGLFVGPDNHLNAEEAPRRLTGKITDNIYWVIARGPKKALTALRVEVFPVRRLQVPSKFPLMSWAIDGHFVLTGFQATVVSSSTNVAQGAPVTANRPLYTNFDTMSAGALTDGWPATIAHPAANVCGSDFFFEIDLGRELSLDHLGLRQRGDTYNLDRFARMRLRLYDRDPKSGATPTWQALNRADGTFPQSGNVDILRASDGQGNFRGRFVRISTGSSVPLSPMLAEFEAYETRTPELVSAKADEKTLPLSEPIKIPPRTARLALQLRIAQFGKPVDGLLRWRLQPGPDDWHVAKTLNLELTCPQPGNYRFEAQAGHSDGVWDSSVLTVPLLVQTPFTKSKTFIALIAASTLGAGGLIVLAFFRRRIAALRMQTALATERTRIARDMHDEVGARLSQLSFLLNDLADDESLPSASRVGIQHLTETAGDAIDSLDEVVWTVNPKNDTLAALCRHLASHASRYLAPANIACRLDCPPDWPDHSVPSRIRHEITMAFKESLQNVIKHSGASEVRLVQSIEAGCFVLRVTDNGCGFSLESPQTERSGLVNMNERLAEIGGSVVIHSYNSSGTEVEFRLPLAALKTK